MDSSRTNFYLIHPLNAERGWKVEGEGREGGKREEGKTLMKALQDKPRLLRTAVLGREEGRGVDCRGEERLEAILKGCGP